jgi:hypothetical protein
MGISNGFNHVDSLANYTDRESAFASFSLNIQECLEFVAKEKPHQ